MFRGLLVRLLIAIATFLDRRFRWYRLWPEWLSLGVLLLLRTRLRRENLHHITLGMPSAVSPPTPACRRTSDGTFNDLAYPTMGAAGTPFGRHAAPGTVRLDGADADNLASSPSPRHVSNTLLARQGRFEPATSINMLAAAWVQFMGHDWFNHQVAAPDSSDPIEVPLADDDPWRRYHGRMLVPRTVRDPTRPACSSLAPTFVNTATHWWDGSQLYGSSREEQAAVRGGQRGCPYAAGKLKMSDRNPGRLPLDKYGAEIAGFRENWWLGLSLMHTLFALEHNAICDRLRAAYPAWWSEENLFGHARLITTAVIAKIHTLEWTPAMLQHPVVERGMHGTWDGLAGDRFPYNVFSRFLDDEVRHGVPGSPTDHHGAPFAITEEFVSVYRLHALLPDFLALRSLRRRGQIVGEPVLLRDLLFNGAAHMLDKHHLTIADGLYSFALASPGKIALHNYPDTLRELSLPNGLTIDLAAVDILRDRERGVPRYNDFREMVHLPRVRSFEELVGKKGREQGWDKDIRDVYGTVDAVDLMVGLFAEPAPPGFAFSDTAFRIFTLMNSRRLQSDRFFTTDFTEAVYTPEGMDWIKNASMTAVLRRHFPELRDPLDRHRELDPRGTGNPFKPWRIAPPASAAAS